MSISRIRLLTISRLRRLPKEFKKMSKKDGRSYLYRRVKNEIVEKFKKDLGDREAMRRQIDKLQDQILTLEDELESAKTKLENGGGA